MERCCSGGTPHVQRFNLMWFTLALAWKEPGTQQIASRKPLVKLKIWTRWMFIAISKRSSLRCALCDPWKRPRRVQEKVWQRREHLAPPPSQRLTNTLACAMSSGRFALCVCREWGPNRKRPKRRHRNHLFQVFSKRFLQTERCLRYEWRHFYWPLRCVAFFLRVYCVILNREEKRGKQEKRKKNLAWSYDKNRHFI